MKILQSLNQCNTDNTAFSSSSRSGSNQKDEEHVMKLHKPNDQKTWQVRPLPPDICRKDICAKVSIVGPLRSSVEFCAAARQCKRVIQAALDEIYTGSAKEASFVLKVYIDTLSNGGFTSTFEGTARGVAYLGEAYLGLTWALWPNRTLAQGPSRRIGGSVAARVDMDFLEFMDLTKYGNRTIIKDLAPEAANLVIEQVGIEREERI